MRVAERLQAEAPGPVEILHMADWHPPLPAGVTATRLPASRAAAPVAAARVAQAAAVVVDTFPAGLFHELVHLPDDATWVARHLEGYPGLEEAAARYRRIWLPYPPGRDPWEGQWAGACVGPLVRRLPMADGPPHDLLVIGDPETLPGPWRARLPADTRSLHRFVAALPAARRVLALGAGHNLCWELAPLPIPVGHVPSHRRYDAPFARALRFGRAILSRADLEVFLG